MLDPISMKATVLKALAAAAWLAKFTPSEMDDKVVAYLQKLAEDDTTWELLKDLLSLLEKNPGKSVRELVAMLKA